MNNHRFKGQQLTYFAASENIHVNWLLIRNQQTREIIDSWKVSSTKAALRKSVSISNVAYPFPIRKDYICLSPDESLQSVL